MRVNRCLPHAMPLVSIRKHLVFWDYWGDKEERQKETSGMKLVKTLELRIILRQNVYKGDYSIRASRLVFQILGGDESVLFCLTFA